MIKPAHKIALIADDHGLYRAGLGLLLKDQLGFESVIEAGTFDEAVDRLAGNDGVELALFDLTMPGMGGPESLKMIRETYPALRVAVVSASEEREHVIATLSAGVAGYITKSLADTEIIAALEGVLQGQIYVPRFLAATTGVAPVKPPAAAGDGPPLRVGGVHRFDDLTPRQRDVLSCILQGQSNKEIARELNIAEGTVKIHLAALFAQFGARNRTELATRAQKLAGIA